VSSAAVAEDDAVRVDRVFQHVGNHCALSGVSLRVARGEGLLIIGPNGAGKTLLTRLIVGLDIPSAGQVRVLGEELARLGDRDIRRLRRRVGAVLQRGSLLDGLTVLDNVLLPLRGSGMTRHDMARAARLAMTQLQLDGLENHLPRSLSLGQRRRVELARGLIHLPDLLVWDGMTDGLDPAAVRDIVEVLRTQQQARGLTVVATDNSTLDVVGDEDRVAALDRGRLLFDGSRAALESAAAERVDLRYVLEGHP
jgi:ABC-type transporter Mla maintaining outer membrane lipid asymmetry ATPase subunit MlaF